VVKNTLNRLLCGSDEGRVWEAFHEASKTSEFEPPASSEVVHKRMTAMWPSFPYEGYPLISLPQPGRLDMALSDVVARRETAHDICAAQLSLDQVATLLFHACGETRDKTMSGYPRKFRTTPSGGAMYPLEVYLHSTCITGVSAGVYHYNPSDHALRRIIDGDYTAEIGAGLIQSELSSDTAMTVFITCVSERSIFKYGERGYRFALLEAGHLAQNFVLAAAALELGAVTIGGYFDRVIDRVLNVDGLDQSAVYMLALGGRSGVDWLA
jgi:SagB-type dehydrogenase family enzyme